MRDANTDLENRILDRTRELTEREINLQDSETRLRDFAEAASDWFWEMDEYLRFTYLSPNLERVLGVRPDELLGRTREELLGGEYDREEWEIHQRVLRARLPFRDFTYAWRGSNWVRISGRPIFNREGEFSGYRGIGYDISDLMESELARRQSEARFRDFAESSADWFWEMDENLRFTWMTPNVEQIVGVPPEWHYGKTREDLLGENYDRDVWDRHLKTLREHRPFRDFVFFRRGDGIEPKWIRTSGKPTFGPDGRFTGYRGSATDITGTRVIEDQLRQAQKMESVGQLTGGIAHDFNNLLGVVIGNLDFLAEFDDLDDEKQVMVETALQSALRGAELTRRLLAFSRNQELRPEATDLNDLVGNMMPLLRRTLGEAVDIRFVAEPALGKSLLDPGQVESALLNLAVNALHAMPEGGSLVIETRNVTLDEEDAALRQDVNPGRYVLLSVTDTGCGIPRQLLDRVFDPFFTTKEVDKGSGLGLSMVHGFVKQSGGHVTIDSEVSRGTTVRMYFPEMEDHASEFATIPLPHKSHYGSGERILVVEDDEDLSELAATVIRKLGYEVIEAPDGPTALNLLSEGPTIDLLFTDIVLPKGLNGRQLAKAALRQYPELKVLYTSGYTENALDTNDLLSADIELIAKPYMRTELARRLHETLNPENSAGAPVKRL
jgi:PAS domain S-box-containing protein